MTNCEARTMVRVAVALRVKLGRGSAGFFIAGDDVEFDSTAMSGRRCRFFASQKKVVRLR